MPVKDRLRFQRNVVEAAAAHAGLRVVSDYPTVVPHTFMGWDPKSVQRLPNGHGELFLAFLTWRDALDKRVIDLIRPLFAAGLRPEVNCCICVNLVFCLPLNSWHSSTEVYIRVPDVPYHPPSCNPECGPFSNFTGLRSTANQKNHCSVRRN